MYYITYNLTPIHDGDGTGYSTLCHAVSVICRWSNSCAMAFKRSKDWRRLYISWPTANFLTSCFAHLSRINRSVFARPAIGSPWVQARSTSIWGSREDAFGRDRVPRPLHCACVAFPFRQSFSYTRCTRASLPRSTSLSLLARTMEGMDITAKFARRREEWVERQNSGEERVVGTRGETRGTLGRGRRDESPAVECSRWRGGPACRAMPLNWIPALSSRQSDAGRAVSMAGFSRSFSPVLPS